MISKILNYIYTLHFFIFLAVSSVFFSNLSSAQEAHRAIALTSCVCTTIVVVKSESIFHEEEHLMNALTNTPVHLITGSPEKIERAMGKLKDQGQDIIKEKCKEYTMNLPVLYDDNEIKTYWISKCQIELVRKKDFSKVITTYADPVEN